jgi:hypothetical protein
MSKNVALVLLMIIALAGSHGAAQQPIGPPGPPQYSIIPRPRETLQVRAQKAGGKLVWRYYPNRSVIYPNVEELAKRSDIVIVGLALGNRSTLTPDGKFITEDFLVRVQDVIKGALPTGRSILVSLPGGSHKFPDGTNVVVMPKAFKQAENGGTYIFLLRAKNTGSAIKGYQLASATQGLFAVKNGQIEPADQVATDPVVVLYRGMKLADFLKLLHLSVLPTTN